MELDHDRLQKIIETLSAKIGDELEKLTASGYSMEECFHATNGLVGHLLAINLSQIGLPRESLDKYLARLGDLIAEAFADETAINITTQDEIN